MDKSDLILEYVMKNQPIHIAQISQDLNLPRQTVQRWIDKLYTRGVLLKAHIGTAVVYSIREEKE